MTRIWCILLAISVVPIAHAQRFEPAAEDLELVSPILEDRLDQTPERIVYVAPLPGVDGDGTRESPRRDLIAVVDEATAGTAIHLAPGVYDMSQIASEYRHDRSALRTQADGESGRPIVLRTNPERYDPDTGQIATLDFNYENDGPGRTAAFNVGHRYWVFEQFEMRRMDERGFWVGRRAHDNTFRELHLHHADTEGRNNQGLILMAASSGGINNVVIGCHLHDIGNIDRATDELLDRGFVNVGCFYSETRFTYDSGEPDGGHDASRAEWEELVDEPDGDVYLIGNEVHDCHYGLGLKTHSRGPYYFLSNHVYRTNSGIFSPFSHNVVRNNILRDTTLEIGRPATNTPRATFFKMTGNGSFSEISHNTVIDGRLQVRGGWSSHAHHNLIIDTDEPLRVMRNTFFWWEDAEWPGVRGEFLIGDLDSSHPFYDLVPGYMKETPGEFRRMQLTDNCYSAEPIVAAADFVQPVADITGMTFDESFTIVSDAQRAGLFVDEAADDYRRVEDDGLNCGSRIGASSIPTPDGGVDELDGGTMFDAGTYDGGTMYDAGGRNDAAMDETATGGGCGCSIAPDDVRANVLWLGLLALIPYRSRRL